MSERFDDGELEATAEELEQARRLGEALERGHAGDDREIERLLETARLVEVSRRFELSPERERALKADLVDAFDRHTRKQAAEGRRAPLLRRLALWFPLPLAAAAAFVVLLHQQQAPREAALAVDHAAAVASSPEPSAATRLEPSPALLRAQALALAEAVGAVNSGEAKQEAPGTRSKQELSEHSRVASASASTERGDAALQTGSAREALERELSLHRAGLMAALDARLR